MWHYLLNHLEFIMIDQKSITPLVLKDFIIYSDYNTNHTRMVIAQTFCNGDSTSWLDLMGQSDQECLEFIRSNKHLLHEMRHQQLGDGSYNIRFDCKLISPLAEDTILVTGGLLLPQGKFELYNSVLALFA